MPRQVSIYDVGTWRDATHVYCHTGSGLWPEARGVWIYTPTGWEKGWPPITSQSNWIDPDGVSDGINSISSTAGIQTVGVGSRLTSSLVTPLSSNLGYAIAFRFQGINSALATTSDVTVDIDISNDGSAFSSVASRTINLTSGLEDISTTIPSASFVSNATGSIIVRPRLSVNNIAGTGTTTGFLYMFRTAWNTDNYEVMWE